MANPNLDHQGFQDFPKLDAPMVDSNGRVTFAWYRLLIRMWQGLGLNFTSWLGTAFLTATSIASNPVTVFGIGPDGQPMPIGDVPIPGSPAANQITFDTLMLETPPDPTGIAVASAIADVGVLQFLTPPDSSGTGGSPDIDSGWLPLVTGLVTSDGEPILVGDPFGQCIAVPL